MKSAKILYIDDELDLLDLAETFFLEESIPIDTCSNLQDALVMIKKNHYDLIISDAKMPSGSGPELLKMIKTEGIYQGKVILVTGNIDSIGVKTDYDLVIYKPIRFQELISEVKRMLSL